MDLKSYWLKLHETYAEEKDRLVKELKGLDPASDEYRAVRDHLKDLKGVESKELEDAVKVAENELKEREFQANLEDRELEASKPSIGPKDILAAVVPIGCTVLVLVFEFVGHGTISSKSFGKIPFSFKN